MVDFVWSMQRLPLSSECPITHTVVPAWRGARTQKSKFSNALIYFGCLIMLIPDVAPVTIKTLPFALVISFLVKVKVAGTENSRDHALRQDLNESEGITERARLLFAILSSSMNSPGQTPDAPISTLPKFSGG